ncbi:hypothetical protein POM88_017273 [Heracleum sosnowskyi]|uniref:Uncharacterized protein n=1 Tax=Heracleum sosnowskyi TaxID=360622 RepID=A0AAD8IS94_9APIA|nr:hypothetical protein POM88_017273 [Heracleum sosnowskyi]
MKDSVAETRLTQQTRGIVSAFSSMDHFSSGYDPPLLLGPLKSPNKGENAISRSFAVAIGVARLYTTSLSLLCSGRPKRKGSIPAILECLFSSARSIARSKQDEVAPLRRQGPFRTSTYELV